MNKKKSFNKTENSYWVSVWKNLNNIKYPLKLKNDDDALKNMTQKINEFLPKKEFTFIEIGCAPASYLIYFKEKFKYDVFGVEYTDNGFSISKKNLKKANIKGTIINKDFFDYSFQKKYKNKFDVVFSSGFIEHFENPKDVIKKHMNLLKKNGYLIITIPNIAFPLNLFQRLLNKKAFEGYDSSMMNLKVFEKLFYINGLNKYYCGYNGFFNFGVLNANKYLLKPLYLLQLVIFNFLKLRGRFSKELLFIGKKVKK